MSDSSPTLQSYAVRETPLIRYMSQQSLTTSTTSARLTGTDNRSTLYHPQA